NFVQHNYPTVNYNFPMVIAKGYEEDPAYSAFEGFYNYRKFYPNDSPPPGIDAFPGNVVNHPDLVTKEQINTNLVLPFPYFLFVLRSAIEAAGYTLEGDILTDQDLIQALIVPSKKYIVANASEPIEWFFNPDGRV